MNLYLHCDRIVSADSFPLHLSSSLHLIKRNLCFLSQRRDMIARGREIRVSSWLLVSEATFRRKEGARGREREEEEEKKTA